MMWLKVLCVAPLSLGIAAVSTESIRLPGRLPAAQAATALIAPVGDLTGESTVRIGKHHRYRRDRDGLFYVTARVNGAKVRFLLDTGANMVVLTPADAVRAGLVPGGASGSDRAVSTMETAAGPSTIDRVTLDRVRVAGRTIDGVDAAVVHHGLKVSLLGQNLLSRLGPVTISGDSVALD